MLLFNVFDEITQEFVARDKHQMRDTTLNVENPFPPPERPVFDGFSIGIFNWEQVNFWKGKRRIGLGPNTDETNMDFDMGPFVARPADYMLIFTADGDTARANVITPFVIWNTTENRRPDYEIQEGFTDADKVWQPGEPIRLWESNLPTWTMNIFARADTLGIEELDTIPGPDFHTIPTSDPAVLDTVWHYIYGDTLPLHTGDTLFFTSTKPFRGGDQFRIRTEKYTVSKSAATALDSIKVVPNPYIVSAEWERNANLREIHFTHLPSECDIHIYTLTGEPVRTIHHNNETVGWAAWNLLSELRQEVSYGLYIYVVKTPDGRTKMGKFAIIR